MRQPCLIFDLDGTLVDSEAIGLQALIDVLPGLPDTVTGLARFYNPQQQVLALPMVGEFACTSQLPTLITQITGS